MKKIVAVLVCAVSSMVMPTMASAEDKGVSASEVMEIFCSRGARYTMTYRQRDLSLSEAKTKLDDMLTSGVKPGLHSIFQNADSNSVNKMYQFINETWKYTLMQAYKAPVFETKSEKAKAITEFETGMKKTCSTVMASFSGE